MKSNLISSLILILFSILFAYFFSLPKYQKWQQTIQKSNLLEKEIRNEEEYFSDLRRLRDTLMERRQDVDKLNTILPNNCSFAELLNFIQNLASQNGFLLSAVSSISLSQVPQTSIYKMAVNITLSGDYSSLKKVLSGIENSSRLIEVEKIDFSAPEKGPTSFNFTISAKCYGY
jgi:Tfp pilus assembly protein PilO